MLFVNSVFFFVGMTQYFSLLKFTCSFHIAKQFPIKRGKINNNYNLHRFLSSALDETAHETITSGLDKSTSDVSSSRTEKLNLSELKSLLRSLGGTPGALRKADLVKACDNLLRLQKEESTDPIQSKTSAVDVIINDWTVGTSAQKAVKSEEPLVTPSKIAQEIEKSEKPAVVPSKKSVRSLSPILPGPQSLEQFQNPAIKGDFNCIGGNIVQDLDTIFSEKTNATRFDASFSLDRSEIEQMDAPQINNVPTKRSSSRHYPMGGTLNATGSVEFKDVSTGLHYWAHHPTGQFRDDRILEGYQPSTGLTIGGPGSGMGDMDLTFLGTASCAPSLTRGVSCLAFRYNSDIWLFDCGEGSQQQMQKSRVKPSKITKIFITHLHGDHTFGLGGVICLIGQSTMVEREKEKNSRSRFDRSDARFDDENVVLDIYGPEGTRDYLRAIIQLSYSKVVHPYRIHELKDIPNLYVKPPRQIPPLPQVRTKSSALYGERPGGQDIYPDKKGHYFLFDENGMKVHAAPTEHSVPCVGYVITEKTKPGRLKVEAVTEAVNRNKAAITQIFKLKDPNKIFGVLKEMKPGSTLILPDGTPMVADEILEPPRTGRKVVVMGDTCNSEMLAPLAMYADVIVHEATNAWIKDQDAAKYPHEIDLERETIKHGHSTPQMAGRFAKKLFAKKLILTHFSARYRGDDQDFSMKIMWKMEHMARKVSDLWGKNDVISAWDHMCLPIRTREDEDVIAMKEQAIRDRVDAEAEAEFI